jgi:hypothetical protein
MLKSKNWIAKAIPSLDGSKTTLTVSADVQSGFIPPALVPYKTKEQLPPNVFALELQREANGATMQHVSFEQDIKGREELDIVLVFSQGHNVVAAITIERVLSLTDVHH